MENTKVLIENILNGTKEYSKKKITYETKSLKNLQKNSSEEFKSMNISLNKDDLDENTVNEIFKMIEEWEFRLKSDYDVYGVSFFKIDEDGNGLCELCGHSGCKYMYKIENTKTHKILYVGSQCIKKFGIKSYIGSEEATVDEVINYINDFENSIDKIINSSYGKLFKFCHENNLVLLNNNNKKVKDFYSKNINKYGEVIFSIIYEIENNRIPSDDLYQEANTFHCKLYDWSNINNQHNLITFVPSVKATIENNQKYSAKFKIVLSGFTADYYRNNQSNKNIYEDTKKIYEETKNINCFSEHSFFDITRWINDRSKDGKTAKPYDILSLILTLPNDREKCRNIIKNYLKLNRERLTSLSIKENFKKYVDRYYNLTIKKNDISEFSDFIKMLHELSDEIIDPYLKERKNKLENKGKKPKINRIRHKNNLI